MSIMILPNDEGDYVENVVDLDGYDHLAIAPGSDATAPKENLVSCFFFHTRTRLAASKLHRSLSAYSWLFLVVLSFSRHVVV